MLPNKANMFDNYMKYLSQHILQKAEIKETVPVMQKSQVRNDRHNCIVNFRKIIKHLIIGTCFDNWKNRL